MDYPPKGIINLQDAVRNLNMRLKKLEPSDGQIAEAASETEPAKPDSLAPIGEQPVADKPATEVHGEADGASGDGSSGSGS